MAAQAFTQLLDRGGLSADGSIARWCPTRDLLALATADGQLHLFRLNWQRLWWQSPDSSITALEWRPDGKQLAVGLEDGTVLLLNAEDGEVAHRAQLVQGSALVGISWTEATGGSGSSGSSSAAGGSGQRGGGEPAAAAAASASSQLSEDRARRMFAPPPPPVPPPSAGLAVGYDACGRAAAGGTAWPTEPPRLALLACASAAGGLVLCTSGLFPLAAVSLPRLLGAGEVSVLRLATAPSLRQLSVAWREGASGPLRLSAISLERIGAHAPRLHRLALAAAHVNALLEGCRQTFAAACKEWGGGMRELEESRERLAALMSDYGALGADPAAELKALLATGAVGGALQQYLTATLGEPGLKKLARSVDAAVCATHALLADHLQPQLEQLAFRLGELRGLALCLPWRRITGLRPDEVEAAEQAALRLVVLAEALRARLVAAGAQYRTFFAWLLTVLRRLSEDAADALVGYPRSHLEAVADFLAGQYQRDVVAPLLGSPESADGGGGSGGADLLGAAAGGGSSMLDLVLGALGRQAQVQAADSSAAASPAGGAVAAAAAAAAAAAGGGGGGSSGGYLAGSGATVGQLLAGLQASCSAAFDRTTQVLSPSLVLSGSLALGPSPAALDIGYQPGGGMAAAVAWDARPQVLLLRSIWGGSAAAAAEAEAAGPEAAVVALPGGAAAVDLAYYKDGQLALLLAGGPGGPRLALLPPEALQWAALAPDLLADSDTDALQLACLLLESEGGPAGGQPLPDGEAGLRQRALPYHSVQAPLAVSGSRGVGCVLAGTQRVVLYDMEEDEEEEEGEEGEEGGAGEAFHEAEGGDAGGSHYQTPANSL